ncbi:hypothetical protein GQ457_01G046620 [Hibiscus cannabinus]
MSGDGSDRLPVRYTLQEYPAQPQQPLKRHHTARYYAHRFTASSSEVSYSGFHGSGLVQPSGFENALISFNVTDRNSNQHIGIYYDSVVGSVFYKDQQIGSAPLMDPFFQEPKTTTIMYGTFTGATLTVSSNRWKEFMDARQQGTVVFRLEITSVIRFRITTWDSQHHKMHVNCDVAVGQDGSILLAWKNKKCPFPMLPIYRDHYCLGPENETATADYQSSLVSLLDSMSFELRTIPTPSTTIALMESTVSSSAETSIFSAKFEHVPYNLRWNSENSTSPDEGSISTPGFMYSIVDRALYAPNMSASNQMDAVDGSGHRYGIAQCSRDLNVTAYLLNRAENCCITRKGWRLLTPSCYINYTMNPHIDQPAPPSENEALGGVFVALLAGFLYQRKKRHFKGSCHSSKPAYLKELNIHLLEEDHAEEMHQFNLATIHAATNNFSQENKFGEGDSGSALFSRSKARRISLKSSRMK